ncbi:MAG: DUF370 domain-containing protein [Ruminococcaceae bacterium]|nr:DUF370 domain-containing protein [Oscillospiraceae bacterium]
MYLHLGADTVVKSREVIGVFDMDNTTTAASTRKFLNTAEKEKRLINISEELPKSFIVCGSREDPTVYISTVSSQTIEKRTGRKQIEN